MTPDPTSTTPVKPRRRWWQFSLRTLLVVMIPIACLFAWLGNEYQRGRRQYAAIKELEQNDWQIEYAAPGEPHSWREIVMPEWYPSPLAKVTCESHGLVDIAPLSALPEVQRVRILSQRMTMVKLAGSEYGESPVPLEGVQALRSLANLRELELYYMQIDDLSPLGELRQLEVLKLAGCPVTDLTPLAGLTQLEVLDISGTGVTSLQPLTSLDNLEKLYVDYTIGREEIGAFRAAHPNCRINPSP